MKIKKSLITRRVTKVNDKDVKRHCLGLGPVKSVGDGEVVRNIFGHVTSAPDEYWQLRRLKDLEKRM